MSMSSPAHLNDQHGDTVINPPRLMAPVLKGNIVPFSVFLLVLQMFKINLCLTNTISRRPILITQENAKDSNFLTMLFPQLTFFLQVESV